MFHSEKAEALMTPRYIDNAFDFTEFHYDDINGLNMMYAGSGKDTGS